MTVTLESVLYRYAGVPADEVEADPAGDSFVNPGGLRKKTGGNGSNKQVTRYERQPKINDLSELVLDPSVHIIIAEDNAMLNSGTFFLRRSQWSLDLMRTIYGDAKTSPWVDHPWWENAALTWNFLKDVSQRFSTTEFTQKLEAWPALARDTGAGNLNGVIGQQSGQQQQQRLFSELPEEERNYWISKEMEDIYTPEVRIAPQNIFNSYHPVTSRFQHDTWEAGKFVLAFNGVLSSTSPTVIRMLYGNYYRQSCELNQIEHLCIPVKETLPWLQSTRACMRNYLRKNRIE